MREEKVDVSLTLPEWHLVSALRDIPESALKARANELIEAVLAYSREPKCPEMQADGVPCGTVHANCDQCVHVTQLLEGLKARV